MDPIIILIATALLKGVELGIKQAVAHEVLNGYFALKKMIVHKYNIKSIDILEKSPTPENLEALKAELSMTKIQRNKKIVNQAREFLDVIREFESSQDDLPFKLHLKKDEMLDEAERIACRQAIAQVVESHVHQVLATRSKFDVDDNDLLTSNMKLNTSVPKKVRSGIVALPEKMKSVIYAVASRIENRKYASFEQVMSEMPIALRDREKVEGLLASDKDIHISFQALKVTVELFAGLNKLLVEKFDQVSSPGTQATLVFGNAILVYELTDFVINYLQGFEVNGIARIHRLYEETENRMKEFRQQQDNLLEMCETEDVDPEVREQTLKDVAAREESLKMLKEEWKDYIATVQGLEGQVGIIKKKIPTLELIRENARAQISLIQTVALMQILKQNILTIESTILTLSKIKLITLSPDRVRRLLGVGL